MPGVLYEFKTTGGADVVRLWENIGQAGQEALRSVEAAAKRTAVSLQSVPLAIKSIPASMREVPRSMEDIRRAAGVVARETDTVARGVYRLGAGLKDAALQAGHMQNAARQLSTFSTGITQAAIAAGALKQGVGGAAVAAEGAATGTGGLALLGLAFTRLIGPAAIGGAVAGLGVLTKRSIENAAALKDEAQAVDVNVTKYQQLRVAFGAAGVGQEKFATLMQTFSKNIGDAQRGTGTLVTALQKTDPALLRFLQGTASVDDKLQAFLDHLVNLPSATQKASLGAAAMGEGFRPVVSILNNTDKGLKALEQRASATGRVLSDELLTKARDTQRQFDELTGIIGTNLQGAVLALAGPLETLAKGFADAAQAAKTFFSGLPKGSESTGPEIDAITKRIAQLESGLPGVNVAGFAGGTAEEQARARTDQILELNRQRAELIQQQQNALRPVGVGAPGEREGARTVVSGLVQRGFPKNIAAGFAGNVKVESGFNPGAINPTGGDFGLLQWTGDRKKGLIQFARMRGRSPSDMEIQLDYIDLERRGLDAQFTPRKTTEKASYDALFRGVTPGTPIETIAADVQNLIERPKDRKATLADRQAAARRALFDSPADDSKVLEREAKEFETRDRKQSEERARRDKEIAREAGDARLAALDGEARLWEEAKQKIDEFAAEQRKLSKDRLADGVAEKQLSEETLASLRKLEEQRRLSLSAIAAQTDTGPQLGKITADIPPFGYLGRLRRPDGGSSTELATTLQQEGKWFNTPLLFPGQTGIDDLLGGKRSTDAQEERAAEFLRKRREAGPVQGFNTLEEALEAEKKHHAELEKLADKEVLTDEQAKAKRLEIERDYAAQRKQLIGDAGGAEATERQDTEKAISDYTTAVNTETYGKVQKIHADAQDKITKKAAAEADKRAKETARSEKAAFDEVYDTWINGLDSISKAREAGNRRVFEFERDNPTLSPELLEAGKSAIETKTVSDVDKEVQDTADDIRKAQEDLAKDAEDAAEKMAAPYLRVADRIGVDLTDSLVDAFLSGEDQARSTADVIQDLFADVAKDILRSVVGSFVSGIGQSLVGTLTGVVGGGVPQQQGFGGLGGLIGGGGPVTNAQLGSLAGLDAAEINLLRSEAELRGTPGGLSGLLGGLGGGGGLGGIGGLLQNPLVGIVKSVLTPVLQSALPSVFGAAIPASTGTLAAATAGGIAPSAFVGPVAPAGAVASNGASAISGIAGAAALVVALAAASKGLVDARGNFDKATLGTAQSAKNSLTGIQAGLLAAFTGGGAAIGSVVPVIGTAVGAAVGAAVATAANSAIEKGVLGGINSSVSKGLTQKQLEANIAKETGQDLILNILTAGLNQAVIAPVLGPLVAPDIERIFAKVFRSALGDQGQGVQGGFDTLAPVGSTSTFGLGRLKPQASQASRIIGEFIGAGGEAFGPEREANFNAILLGAVKKFVATQRRHGQHVEEEQVLAQAFASAFDGIFFNALAAAEKLPSIQRKGAVEFTAQQFGKVTGLGTVHQQVADLVEEQGVVPTGKARKAAKEAFAQAFEAALSDAADSTAFQKSLASSVQEAFVGKAGKLFDKTGQLFAPFFALSKEARPEFQRAKRQGNLVGGLEILSEDFIDKSDEFAKIVSNPGFTTAISALNDAFLKLQVSMLLATGDTQGAADVIKQQLAPQLQLIQDVAQLGRDVRSRTAIALAGPGFAGDKAQIDELTRQREEVQQRFSARFEGAGLDDFRRLLTGDFPHEAASLGDQGLVAADRALQQTPREVLDAFREFADARLAELEGEIALARAQAEFFKQTEKSFRSLSEQASQAQQKGFGIEHFGDTVGDAITDYAAVLRGGIDDPELVGNLQESLSKAIAEAANRVQVFDAFVEQFKSFRRAIDQTLKRGDDRTRIAELRTEIDSITDPTDPLQMGKAAAAMGEAIQLATVRFEAFTAAVETFKNATESIDIALKDLDATDVLQRRLGDVQELLPKALGGDLQATQDIAGPLNEAIGLAASQLDAFTAAAEGFRDVVEAIDVSLKKVSQPELIARRRAEIDALLPKALSGNLRATQDIRRPLDAAVGLATQRRDTFQSAADEFDAFAEQAGLTRGGRRAQRSLLASRRSDITRLLGVARGGGAESDDAITQLRRLLPETLSLGSQTLSTGRQRRLAAELETAGNELASLSKGQVTLAEQQLSELQDIARALGISSDDAADDASGILTELRTIADALGRSSADEAAGARAILDDLFGKAGALETVAEEQRTTALATLVTLGRIADAVADSAGDEAGDAESRLGKIKKELEDFRIAVDPVVKYLTAKAGVALEDQFTKVIEALGDTGPIKLAIDRVAKGLGIAVPQAQSLPSAELPTIPSLGATAGLTAVPTGTTVTVNAPVTINVTVPTGTSQAEAGEFSRTIATQTGREVERAIRRSMSNLRKVA